MGVGVTAINNARFVVGVITFPDDITFRLGTIMAGESVGGMLGPVMAGLADYGGYYLPFLVIGLVTLLPATMATITMPTQTSKSSESASILGLLTIPGILIMAVGTVLTLGLPAMPQPILAPHLQPFGLSLTSMGAVFLICPLLNTMLFPIVGKIAGVWEGHELLLVIFGTFGMAGSCLFLGPSPLIGLKPYEQLWPTLVSFGAIGFFNAFALVPSNERFITYATYARPDVDPEALMTAVGSIITLLISCSDFLSPTLAGSLYDALGFQWTMTVGGLMAVFSGTMILTAFIRFRNGEITWRKSDGKNKEKSDGETEALLAALALQ